MVVQVAAVVEEVNRETVRAGQVELVGGPVVKRFQRLPHQVEGAVRLFGSQTSVPVVAVHIAAAC